MARKFPTTMPVRLTVEEAHLIRRIAKAEDLKVSEFLRIGARALLCDFLEENETIPELVSENIAA